MVLTLEARVGQVMMCGFAGRDPELAKELIMNYHVGGIIYFSHNLNSVAEAAHMSHTMQEWACLSPSGVPLFIATDQEGGTVARLTADTPRMPGAMALAAASLGCKNKRLVRQVYYAMGRQLRAAGINVDLAPVLDINDNPHNPVIGVRSFGDDPQHVAALGVEAVKGLTAAGVLAVGKHFPGHGNTATDSHFSLPVISRSLDELREIELIPFTAATAAGMQAVMTAHIVFEALDSQHPATLSRIVLGDLLRKQLGFQGIVMSDCLEMSAIAQSLGSVRGAVQAIAAGVDMVLISHCKEIQTKTFEALLSAVKSGELPERRLNEAVQRVLVVKKALGVPNPVALAEAKRPCFAELSRKTHLGSITVVRDREGLIPLRPRTSQQGVKSDSRLRVLLAYGANLPGQNTLSSLTAYLTDSKEIEVTKIEVSTDRWQDSVDANQFDAVILLTHNLTVGVSQRAVAADLVNLHTHTIVVALQDPQDMRAIPNVGTYVCTYGFRAESMKALSDVLRGDATATGCLPVKLRP